MKNRPAAAKSIPANKTKSAYPQAFASRVQGRVKRKLGDYFDLTNFGVNLTTLGPGAISALKHYHRLQDEFIYVLEGTPTLVLGEEELLLGPGDCYGFRAGVELGHQLINKSNAGVTYLEIGDRTPGDSVQYPDDDLLAQEQDGKWVFLRKDGEPY
jgi:uncharacterized cupin superfamily protein